MSAKLSSNAKALIAAHRKAMARHEAAMRRIKDTPYPDRAHVNVAEIGPRCVAYDMVQLDRMGAEHIDRQKLTGLDRVEFNKQMLGYREVLTLLESLNQGWRRRYDIDAIEAEQTVAFDELEKAWKALIARIKSNPRDIPEIARYFSTPEASGGDFWRPRKVLLAIAGVGRKLA